MNNNIYGEASRGCNGYSQYPPIDKQALLAQAQALVNANPVNPKVDNLVNSGAFQNGGANQMNNNSGFAQTNIYNQPMYNQSQINLGAGYNTGGMQQVLTTDCSSLDGETMCDIAMRRHIFETSNDYVDDRLKEKGKLKSSHIIKVTFDPNRVPDPEEEKEFEDPIYDYVEEEEIEIDFSCPKGSKTISELFTHIIPNGTSNRKTTFNDRVGYSSYLTKESEEYYRQKQDQYNSYQSNTNIDNTSSFMPMYYDFAGEKRRQEAQQQYQATQSGDMVAEQATQQPFRKAQPVQSANSTIENKNLLYSSKDTEKIKEKCMNIIGRYRSLGIQSGVSIEDLYAAYHTLNYGRSGLNFRNAVDDYVNQLNNVEPEAPLNELFPVRGEKFVFDKEKVENDPDRVKVPTQFGNAQKEVAKKKHGISLKSIFNKFLPKKDLVSSIDEAEIKYDANNKIDLDKVQKDLGITYINQKSDSNIDINAQMFNMFNNSGYNQVQTPKFRTYAEIEEENKQRLEQQKTINFLAKGCMKYFGSSPNNFNQVKQEQTPKLNDEQICLLNEMILTNLRKEEMYIAEQRTEQVKQQNINMHNQIRADFLSYFEGGEDVYDFFESAGELYGDIQKENRYIESRKGLNTTVRSYEENTKYLHSLANGTIQRPYERVLSEAGIKMTAGMSISEDGTLNVSAPDFIKRKYEQRRQEYQARKNDFLEVTNSKPRALERQRTFINKAHRGRVRPV